jgi:hypothetical protein
MLCFNQVFPESFASAAIKEEEIHVEILLNNEGFYTPQA